MITLNLDVGEDQDDVSTHESRLPTPVSKGGHTETLVAVEVRSEEFNITPSPVIKPVELLLDLNKVNDVSDWGTPSRKKNEKVELL